MTLRVAVLTVSDGASRGDRDDTSGARIADWALTHGWPVVSRETVPDESDAIVRCLAQWADGGEVDLILTTGGTGLSPRDHTPEATRAVIEREVPGIPEALRGAARATVPRATLSRGVAGLRGRTLIVNLPGSEAGVRDGLSVLDPIVGHAVAIARGDPVDHV